MVTDSSGRTIIPRDENGRLYFLSTDSMSTTSTIGSSLSGSSSENEADSGSGIVTAVVIAAVVILLIVVGAVVVVKKKIAAVETPVVGFDNPMYDSTSDPISQLRSGGLYADTPENFGEEAKSSGYMDINPSTNSDSNGYMDVSADTFGADVDEDDVEDV